MATLLPVIKGMILRKSLFANGLCCGFVLGCFNTKYLTEVLQYQVSMSQREGNLSSVTKITHKNFLRNMQHIDDDDENNNFYFSLI